jgi:hypothetical protein
VTRLARQVAAEVTERPVARVVVKVRYAPFITVSHGVTLPPGERHPSAAGERRWAETIETAASASLAAFTPGRQVRLLGVRAEFADNPDLDATPLTSHATTATEGRSCRSNVCASQGSWGAATALGCPRREIVSVSWLNVRPVRSTGRPGGLATWSASAVLPECIGFAPEISLYSHQDQNWRHGGGDQSTCEVSQSRKGAHVRKKARSLSAAAGVASQGSGVQCRHVVRPLCLSRSILGWSAA